MSYTAATWSPAGDAYSEVVFEGHDILRPGDGLPFRIEGRINENSIMNPDRPEARLMMAAINENPCLEQIPAGDYLTDAAIDWWLEQNPDALGSATKLNFNILPENSSLVEHFEASRDKKNSSRYTAALFDIRGYSVIVVKQKADGNYVLAWAEPECETTTATACSTASPSRTRTPSRCSTTTATAISTTSSTSHPRP